MKHQIIRASAGSGKTYQLANRYVRLLMQKNVSPERIVAMTFTRKAAGEFFEKIFGRLTAAARCEAEAGRLSSELGIAATADDYRAKLRLVLGNIHRLQLSTYDSFFSRIVRAFPLELGLEGPPRVIEGAEREDALADCLLSLQSMRSNGEAAQEIWQAFKRATFGKEVKSIGGTIERIVSTLHSLYLEAPDPSLWDGSRIWPDSKGWTPSPITPAEEAEKLQHLLDWENMTETQRKDWTAFIQELQVWEPGPFLGRDMKKFVGKFLEVYEALPSGNAAITVRRAMNLSPELGAVCQRIAGAVLEHLIYRGREATRGRFELLVQFERVYNECVRRTGNLSFSDVTQLLSSEGSPLQGDAGLGRELVDYRLDGFFDHWLLDEFQDTSFSQWRAIANLMDEVLQEPSGNRTFFAVGDTKQSIYLWRESYDELFQHLKQRYSNLDDSIALSVSYRSGPDVLNMVNQVFGDRATMTRLFGESVAERWASGWSEHAPSDQNRNLSGYAAMLVAEGEDEKTARFSTALRLLNEIKPKARGLSAAILVRDNSEAVELHEFIKSHNGPETALSTDIYPWLDNSVGALAESLLSLVVHPGDKLAEGHLRMTPASFLADEKSFRGETLSRIAESGFEALLRSWFTELAKAGIGVDAFSHLRARQILDGARKFDQAGVRDIDDFLRHIRKHAVKNEEAGLGSIPILTIHKAKGLEWDLVLLPSLKRDTLLQRNNGDVSLDVERDASGNVQWIFDLPVKDFLCREPGLVAFNERLCQKGAFESLCLLYVAMTRAKRGLYVITTPTKPNSNSHNYYKLLEESLPNQAADLRIEGEAFRVRWQTGDSSWFGLCPGQSPEPAKQSGLLALPAEQRPVRSELRLRRPSQVGSFRINAATLFDPPRERGRELGTAVHALFEQIEWLGAEMTETAAVGQLGPHLSEAGATEVLSCLRSPEVRELFTRPSGEVVLWRERPFVLVEAGTMMSGKFDRIVLHRDQQGHFSSAEIIDFKTDTVASADEIDAAVESHRAQMADYQRALSAITGLPENRITAWLVFTCAGVRRCLSD